MKTTKLRKLSFQVFSWAIFANVSVLFSQNLPPVNLKIAFIGDSSVNRNSRAVMEMIKEEGASAVVHAGDFGYSHGPAAFEDQINTILGEDFPYFGSIGNHDDQYFYEPGGYKELLEARMQRIGLTWDGEIGVKSSFYYNGIFIVLTAPGLLGEDHAGYIEEKLAGDHSIWRISTWHLTMPEMQVYEKEDECGCWPVYENSRAGGAIIVTGHAHTYSRTHLLSDMENQVIASTSDTLRLNMDNTTTPTDEGRTFVAVSGLGGRNIKNQDRDGDWWASIYTSTQNATYGALFGIFNYEGAPNLARFYFKNIKGVVIDSFFVFSELEDVPVPVELSSFHAVVNEDNVILEWQTISETDNYGFDIERAYVAEKFTKVGFVSGNGTATRPHHYSFLDRDLAPGHYKYRLRQIDLNGDSEYSPVISVDLEAPATFSLSQSYPNPVVLAPNTESGSVIRFTLSSRQQVRLTIYNVLGQTVRTLLDKDIEAGSHHIAWDTRDQLGVRVNSGVYVYELKMGDYREVKKMLLVR